MRVTLLLLLLPAHAAAQAVDVRLRDEVTAKPIAGAIVRLLRNDSVIAQALTSELGLTRLLAPAAGSYRLRVDRIGFAGFVSSSFSIEPNTPFRAEIAVRSTPLTLPEVVVTTRSACEVRPREGAIAAALWEEVRKALTANLLSQQQGTVPVLVREFEREVTRAGRPVREWTYRSAFTRGPPFGALPASELRRKGFVYMVPDGTVFAAPDARLLLSDEFVGTHCFRAIAGPAGRTGLAFEPVRNRQVTDISGTLWIDRASSELKELQYEYVGLPEFFRREDLGGRVEFQRLTSGRWIVSYWHVRMPMVEQIAIARSRRGILESSRLVSFLEQGGRSLVQPDTTRVLDRAILAGWVSDSTGAGLEGVLITVLGGHDSVLTNSAGEFGLLSSLAGPRLVRAQHPRLSVSRTPPEQEVVLSLGDTARVEFQVPALLAVVRAWCGGGRGKKSGVIGTVWKQDGSVAAEAQVVASFRTPMGEVRTVGSRPRGREGFTFCELPPDQPITIRLRDKNSSLTERTFTLGWGEFQWIDLKEMDRP